MQRRFPAVIVFAKHPTPGKVKTRLIGRLGAERAAEVHRRCLELTLACVRAVRDVDIILAGSPDDADFKGILGDDIEWTPQGQGDLGARLGRAIDRAFDGARKKVLVVGSDCPGMTPPDLSEAFDLLDRHDVVIGPALDGGYYLIGLRRPAPMLLESIDWSTDRVLAQTQAKAAKAGLSLALLTERRDLDEPEDLRAALAELPGSSERLSEFKSFLRRLTQEGRSP